MRVMSSLGHVMDQRGGVALIMLIGFIGLAVPITIASIQTSSQLSRNSRVYDARLNGMYNSGSAVEVAVYEIFSDPTFADGLTPTGPSKTIQVEINGETVTVTVTKVFSSSSVEGQGLIVTKTVMPTSTPVDTATTYTYTIKIKNEGTGTQDLTEIKDFMPPGLTYVPGSTTGDITAADPIRKPGGADEGERFLNDGAGPALPWSADQGNDQITGSHTPAQGVWEEVPEYWETPAYVADGLIRATSWEHIQWLQTPIAGNRWRWKVQLVRGGVSDLFTSIDKVVGSNNQWKEKESSHSPGDISILAGDKLRIRLEVWSGNAIAANRKMEYRWGGAEPDGPDYDSRTDIPHLSYCTLTPQYEFKWPLFPAVQIGPQEEKTLTFQATATLPDGTYYNQVEAKYDSWWSIFDTKTRSSQTAPVTVGSGTPVCINRAELVVTQTVTPQEVTPGVETEFTHTITMENISPVTLWTCRVKDWLPPTFTYVTGSTSGAIDREPKDVKWKADEGRYEAKWDRDQYPENNDDFMFSIGSGATKSFSFKTLGTVEQGMTYYNEIKEVKYNDVAFCDEVPKALGGTNFSGAIFARGIYDVAAVAADGTVKARVILSSFAGEVDIISWQEN